MPRGGAMPLCALGRTFVCAAAMFALIAHAGEERYAPHFWRLPDQPGALSEAETNAARVAYAERVKTGLAPGAAELVARGNNPDDAEPYAVKYAVFATPFERVSE